MKQMQHPLPKHPILTVKEVAQYLRVSRVTIWRWCKQGTLPASRVGRNWRIHRDELLNMLEGAKTQSLVSSEYSTDSTAEFKDVDFSVLFQGEAFSMDLAELVAETEVVEQ